MPFILAGSGLRVSVETGDSIVVTSEQAAAVSYVAGPAIAPVSKPQLDSRALVYGPLIAGEVSIIATLAHLDYEMVRGSTNPTQRSDMIELSAAQIATPSAEILRDTDATYKLRDAPYTRYRSDGAALVELGSGGSTTGGDMIAANNLSDVVSAPASRVNLGLEIGVNVQAFQAKLATFAAASTPDTVPVVGGASSLTLVPLGSASASAILRRSDADTRYPRVVSATPAAGDGVDGDVALNKLLLLFLTKTAGAWAPLQQVPVVGESLYNGTYPAANYSGQTLYVSTWGVWTINDWFTSDGTKWYPDSRVLRLQDSVATSQATLSAAVETVLKTDLFPANMFNGAGRLFVQADFVCVGANGTHQPKYRFGAAGAGIGGTPLFVMTPAAVSVDIHQSVSTFMTITSNTAQHAGSATDGSTSGNINGATARSNFGINLANATEICYTYTQASALDTVSQSSSFIEVHWPSRKT